MKFILSICIPTYNRAEYIIETLESVVSQLGENSNVEITVSDNASKDNTKEIVESFQKRYKHIKYFRWDKNQGADRNYLKAVELASGEYCLILGSDDVLKKNAIIEFINNIKKYNSDIYLYGRDECDINLNLIRQRQFFNEDLHINLGLPNDITVNEYFKKSTSLACVFSYISSIVFRRAKWHVENDLHKFLGTGYVHVYILMSILLKDGSLLYVHKSFLLCRLGNDSFMNNGYAARIDLDLDGYKKISDHLIDDSAKHNFLSILNREHDFLRIAKYLYFSKLAKKENMNKLIKLKFPTYKALFGYILAVSGVIPVLLFLKNKIII